MAHYEFDVNKYFIPALFIAHFDQDQLMVMFLLFPDPELD